MTLDSQHMARGGAWHPTLWHVWHAATMTRCGRSEGESAGVRQRRPASRGVRLPGLWVASGRRCASSLDVR